MSSMFDISTVVVPKYIIIGVSALFGALIDLVQNPEITLKLRFVRIFVGVTTAIFLTPMVIHYTGMPENLDYGVAFLIGTTGMSLTTNIKKRLEKHFKQEENNGDEGNN